MSKDRRRDPAGIFEEDTESFDTRTPHPVVTPLLSSARVMELPATPDLVRAHARAARSAIPFRRMFVDGRGAAPAVGDRFIYHRRTGAVYVFRDGADVTFLRRPEEGRVDRVFVGRDLDASLVRPMAELYARLGHLEGLVRPVADAGAGVFVYEVLA